MSRVMMVVLACIGAAGVAPAEPDVSTKPERSGWLGVYTENLSKPMLAALDIGHGVLVTDVAEESPASAAGIEVGDVLLSVDGEKLERTGDLRSIVRARPDKSVTVALRRRGRERRVTVKLGSRERPEPGVDLGFNWPGVPLEAMRSARAALKDIGPGVRGSLAGADEALDSLRAELEELREELRELRRRVGEGGK